MAVENGSSVIQYKKISSKIIPGVLHVSNKGAIDWGWQGLIAYGCQRVVVVVDSSTEQILQCLEKHQSYVTKVRWPCESYYYHQIYPYTLKLASADNYGNIIIWNVKEGKMLCQFNDGNKPISELQWLPLTLMEGGYDLLAVLHPPYSFIVWNAQTGTKLWKKTYTESLLGFTFDPFCVTNLAFLGNDCILLVEDFTLNKVPSSNGRKYFVTSPSVLSTSSTNLSNFEADDKSKTKEKLRRKARLLVGAEKQASRMDDGLLTNECIAFSYHPARRHHLLLVYPREVLVLDLEINQTVGMITVEKSSSPFLQIIPLCQRDAICGLHENGIVSLHVCEQSPERLDSSSLNMNPDNYVEIIYDTRAQSDPIRLTKLHHVVGLAVCPQTEASVAVLISDGRILILDLKPRFQLISYPMYTLCHLVPPVYGAVKSGDYHLKFVVSGILQCAAAPPFVIRMCPPLTTKNWSMYQPWMAAGTTSGIIQIFDMAAGMLHKELSVHTYPVRGIEWISLSSFLSYAHQNVSNSVGHVRNELFLTDVKTGKSKVFRSESQEESPIEMIRVSHLKQYFIVAFKDDPFELWDIRSLTLLRAMARHFPIITALEWAPIHNLKSLKKKLAMADSHSTESSFSSLITTNVSMEPKTTLYLTNVPIKENFIFADTDGRIYQFNVEGSIIKDGNKLPAENSIGSITSISWKGEQLAMGDVDGNLSLWDLKARYFKVVPTHRGWIKRVRFAPGRGNMKILVLYNDGVDIWDAREIKLVGQLKAAKDVYRVEDADWAASDKPILATSDGCLRIMDLYLNSASSPIEERECFESYWCPSLLPSSYQLRTVLLHTKPFQSSSFDICNEKVATDQADILKSHLDIIDREYKDAFGYNCPLNPVHYYLLVTRLLGDEGEVKFWQVAQHYLQKELIKKSSMDDTPKLDNCLCCQAFYLDGNYDILCDTATYKKMQLDRLAVHESKQTGHEHACKCADTLILLQETDRAVQHLLETDPSSENFYTDCLRACIVASVQSSGISQSTIKLVATNLIANGHISEGVQLLCLIGKGVDACRYLQTYGKWEKAMWLAKSTLNESELLEVAKRWTDHLVSPQIDQKGKAILVMMSMQQFTKVLEMLLSFGYLDRAALFAEVCDELKVLQNENSSIQLLKDVFLKYARFLQKEDNKTLALHYAAKAGAVNEFVEECVSSAESPSTT